MLGRMTGNKVRDMGKNLTSGDFVHHTEHPEIYPTEHWGASIAQVPNLRLMKPSEVGCEHPWTP